MARARGSAGRCGSRRRRARLWACVGCALLAATACAPRVARAELGGLVFPELRADHPPVPLRLDRGEQFARGVTAEVADVALFGVPGLRASGLRVGWGAATWRAAGSVVRLGADVGAETTAGVSLARAGDGWEVGVVLRRFTTVLAGEPSAALVTAGVATALRAGDGFDVWSSVEGVRLSGADLPGAAVAVGARVASGGLTSGVAVALDRWGDAGVRLTAALRLVRALALAAAYDDATGATDAALSASAGRTHVTVGVSMHPVLGRSQGVSVSWGR